MLLQLVHKFLRLQLGSEIANPNSVVWLRVANITCNVWVKRFKPGLLRICLFSSKA